MSIIHVLPVNDLFEHEKEGTGCSCNPRLESVPPNDNLIVVHNSFDGRELLEPDHYEFPLKGGYT